MTLAEFVAKLQEYPQHMEIVISERDYTVKIYGFLKEADHMITLVDCAHPPDEPMLWADTVTFKQLGEE